MDRRSVAYLVKVAMLGAFYVVAAKAAFAIAFVNTSIAPVWLPSGLAVAVSLRYGYRAVPGVLLGASAFNALTPVPLWVAGLIGIGNSLEAAGAVWLLRRAAFRPALDRVRDVLALAGLGALAATVISATIGVASLWAGHVVPPRGLASSWVLWWSGDAVGVLTVSPLLLWAWSRYPARRRPSAARLVEAVLLALALAAVVLIGVTVSTARPIMTLAPVVWAAIRYRQAGAVLASLFSSVVVVFATAHGLGPYVQPTKMDSLLATQVFVAVVVATSLLLAAMTVERETAIGALQGASAELAHERSQLREAQRIADLGSWEWDVQADQMHWSDAMCRICGMPGSAVLDYQSFLHRVHPQDRSQVDAAISEALGRGGSFAFEHRIVRPDGQVRVQQSRGIAVLNDGGAVARMVGTAQDITERRRAQDTLRAQQEQTQAILDSASDPFISIDRLGVVTAWNRSAETLFGRPAGEAIGRSLTGLIVPQGLREACQDGLQRTATAGPLLMPGTRMELAGLHRDGHEIPLELAIWQVPSDTGHFHAFLRDMSEPNRLARALEAAKDEAVEASRLKSQFLATMSHEIRTPMNAVLGLTAALRADAGRLDARHRISLDGIHCAGQILRAIIDDILDFSKLEAGRLVLDDIDFDLDAVIAETTGMLADAAAAKGLTLAASREPQLPAALRGDPIRLRQILLNLLSNAVKFTERGSVTVRATAAGPVAAGGPVLARIEVTDTGIGIAADKQARLFDAFIQADATTTRGQGGTGLGLAIVRGLAEAMDGQLDVVSEPGQGSTFACTVRLRAATPATQISPGPGEAGLAPAAEHAQLLLVEDNELNRLVAVEVLTILGYSIDIATDGRHAVEMARTRQYQAILMDCQMPVMDGYTAAAAIRQLEAGSGRTPIIAMTASVFAEDRARCQAAGMDDFVAKPIDVDTLAATLARWTGTASRDPAVAAPPARAEPQPAQ